MDGGDRREMYRGFSDTLARSVEMVGTPFVFGTLGYFLDRWLGLSPVLLIVFSAFGLVGMALRTYYAYEHQMREEEARLFGGEVRQ